MIQFNKNYGVYLFICFHVFFSHYFAACIKQTDKHPPPPPKKRGLDAYSLGVVKEKGKYYTEKNWTPKLRPN